MILEQVLANKATWRHLGWYRLVCWLTVPWPSVYVTNWPQLPGGLDYMRHGGSGLVSWQGKVELLNLSFINIQAQTQQGNQVLVSSSEQWSDMGVCLRACALSHLPGYKRTGWGANVWLISGFPHLGTTSILEVFSSNYISCNSSETTIRHVKYYFLSYV